MSLTATAERGVMNAENQVHKLFLRYVETIGHEQRSYWFESWNRDAWVIGFGEWLAEQQLERIKNFGASND